LDRRPAAEVIVKVLKYAALALITLVGLFLLIGLLLPSSVHIERTAVIDRPAVQVFTVLESYRLFNKWSPWAAKDPQAKYTWEGPESGVGASMSWVGNSDVGQGRMTIQETRPNEMVRTLLDFADQGTADAVFRLEPAGAGTRVTWGFDAPFGWNIPARWFGLMFDRMLGPDYERGLGNLKALVETFPNADWTGMKIVVEDVPAADLITSHCTTSMDLDEIHHTLAAAYGRIGAAIQANKLQFIGPVLTLTNSSTATSWDFDAAVVVSGPPAGPLDEGLAAVRGYAGPAVKGVYVGPYSGLMDASPKVAAWVAAHGYEPADRVIEQYVSDPGDTPPDQLITNIVVPVKQAPR
jgi:effector-binding domain-containing protein